MFARFPPAILLTLAIMAGASMDATIKFLSQTNHVLLVAFGRYLFGALFSAVIWQRAGRPTITRAAHKSGARMYVEMSFAVVRADDGAVLGAVAVARDATDRYERERGQQ